MINSPEPLKIKVPKTQDVEACQISYDSPKQQQIITEIKYLLTQKNAVLVAHYYVAEIIQQIAEQTDGFVSDSLDMAKFGRDSNADILIVAGVKFMGETAKILSPEKIVLMPDLNSECSLDLGCDAKSFKAFCEQHPDRKIVVYSNTSAEVKAFADYVVTSSIAVKLINRLKDKGEKIIWAPDKHLGRYLQKTTNADMLLWNASCVVHDEFKSTALEKLLKDNPRAGVLVHPESPEAVIELADVVGSTTQLINATQKLPNQTLIVATDKAIFYKMKQVAPNKTLIPAPTFGEGATCVSCAHCPWMAMNNLDNLLSVLKTGENEILLDENIRKQALHATKRMFDFI